MQTRTNQIEFPYSSLEEHEEYIKSFDDPFTEAIREIEEIEEMDDINDVHKVCLDIVTFQLRLFLHLFIRL